METSARSRARSRVLLAKMFSVGWQIRDEPRAEAKRPRRAKSANALAAKSHSKFVKWRAHELVRVGRAPGAKPRKILNDARA